MGPAPRWPSIALRFLAPVVLLVLVAQYLLGLWTSLYAPAAGFTSQSSSPALAWHYNLGFALGILGILVIVVAAASRRISLMLLAVVMFVGVLVAGLAGGSFVRSSPNSPSDSLLMGGMFLLAFIAGLGLSFQSWMRVPSPPPTGSLPASG